MTAPGHFSFLNNRREAFQQELDLARQHVGEVRALKCPFNPDHVARYRDARERLDRASELLRQAEGSVGA